MGNKQRSFSWGIGRKTNNEAEWLGLIKGLELTRDLEIESLVVVGDSLIIIREARSISKQRKNPSSKIHFPLLSIVKEFKDISFFHILRDLNSQVNSMATLGVNLRYGTLEYDHTLIENVWVP